MVEIEIGNSYSKISGLASGPFGKLRKLLSYEANPQAAFFSGNQYSRVKYCIDRHGNFPSGLLPHVAAFLDDTNVQFTVVLAEGAGLKPPGVNHKPLAGGITPHAWQRFAAGEVFRADRGIISAPTGSGKSLVIALIIALYSVRTLVVVPTLQIREQLKASLMEHFGDMSNIVVENIDSKALKTLKGFGLLLIDESHHVAAKSYQTLNKTAWKGIYHRVFLTATPFRNNTEETLLFEGIAGQVVYQLTYKDAVKAGYICPIEAYYLDIPKVSTEAYTWQQVYSELVVNNEAKNAAIASVLTSLVEANMSTLCLVKEVKHGQLLSELTGVPFANGQDEDSRVYIDAFNKRKIRALIGTEGILGEGVDTKPCEYVVIAGAGKAKSAFMQKVGRCVRRYLGKESGKVIIIRDGSHRFLLKHFREQCAILKSEYDVKPVKLEIE